MNILKEGGNVFKDAQGQPATQRVNKQDVPATIAWIESVLGMEIPEENWLGSTGKAATSGDLDLAIDTSKINKEQLAARLIQYVTKQGQDPANWVKKAGEVHLKTPIAGDPNRGFVQADFMFFPNMDWGRFYYAGGTNSSYKGMIRNVLMSSLAKFKGLKIGANGMFDRSTNQLSEKGLDPDYVASVVLGPGKTRDDLKNVESIYKSLENDSDKDAKLKDFREFLAKENLTEPEMAVQESDVHFLARLRDRIVNQGMLPLVEDDRSIVIEGKDPRIPYVEDLVFKAGLKGLNQALDIIKQSAEDSRKFVTIKWDGSPAIIFGRKPNGEFVLTDKAGATAVGYDGLATSPTMISNIMQRRDTSDAAKGKKSDRSSLSQMYRNIWPYFEAAVPENFRGYVKGDLLYHPQDPYEEQSGLYMFQPNKYGGIPYRIPIDSPLGQQIAGTRVGVALHTQMADPTSPEEPITKDVDKMFLPVPDLMMSSAKVKNLQNIVPNQKIVQQLNQIARSNGQAINQLLNPAELRAMKITDLPALMESFINSLKGTDYSQATPAEFGKWLQSNVTPNKFQNIIEYLNSPKSNITGMAAAFTAWNLLHDLKIDIKQQLDLQQPGQEGWVMATPAGRAKIVDRRAGGFAGDRALNKQS